MMYSQYPSPARRRGASKIKTVILVLVLLGLSMGIGALLGKYQVGTRVREVFAPPFGGRTIVRLLVLGEDNTGNTKEKPRGLSDTILLVSVDLNTKKVSAISIPRDTRIELGGQTRKINAAYSIGGPVMTERVVEQITGIHPDYYLMTNLAGFQKTVDILGGVEIDVEKNMHYDDNWGNLHINLKKGRQFLDGSKAMQYVRFRHDALGDITRMQRQQKFLKALVEQSMAPSKISRFPRVVSSLLENVRTDMNPKDVIYLAKFAGKVQMSEVKMDTLPGVPENIGGASYWVHDPARTYEVVRDLFLTTSTPGLPKVEVLNGSGVSGAAQKVADALKAKGYEVVSIGNADSFRYDSSQIISHKKDIKGLDGIMGMFSSRDVKEDITASPKADVTVVVGKDVASILSGT